MNADIREEKSKKGEAQRILDDLTNKHNNANQHFESLLDAANKDKAKAEQDLNQLRGQVQEQTRENVRLNDTVNSNEKEISSLAAKIAQINNDLNSLKAKNMTEIQSLEGEREQNEKIIIKFKNDLSQADHDFATLQIMIEKT